MRSMLSAVAAVAFLSCGPDLEEGVEGTQTQAVIEVPVPPRAASPTRLERPHPEEVAATPEFQTFEEAYAYTVCALGYCR